ncbi:LPXTG cell wall anchor domain-containing protein [Candidatus Woesearchaeota archaeon]|nr:LPXTG cell wall anchor domain-containing protein [Candidatus Woesearchaeota archaeon]
MKKIVLLALFLLSVVFVAAIPQVGDTGTDTTYGSYNWKVCRADEDSAWVSADSSGTFSPINVCNGLGYSDVDAWGGTCGDVCGYCYGDSYYNPSNIPNWEHYDFAGGDKTYLAYTVHWRCVDYAGGQEPGDEPIPEFTVIGAGITLLSAGIYALLKRKKK